MAGAQFADETDRSGRWVRQGNAFTGRVTLDSASGPGEGPDERGRWPVEPGRYRLIVSLACPWAHRSVIVRRLLGLEDAIGLSVVDPIRDERGWRFTLGPGESAVARDVSGEPVEGGESGRDPATGLAFLADAYRATDPDYRGRVTVPTLYDTRTRTVVSNDYPQISLDLSTQWGAHHRPGAPELYPAGLREAIDALNAEVYRDVNNGVYKCGFATGQAAYEEAYRALFDRLDVLSARLTDSRYLMGDAITEADVRLFTTLVRFDAVYHGHFKCNRNKLTELPVLWAYAKDLYRTPGFGDTVDFDHIKRHYYLTHHHINPTAIVPLGPDPSAWSR